MLAVAPKVLMIIDFGPDVVGLVSKLDFDSWEFLKKKHV